MDECRRSGQIPAFGNWDYANELPITQYFESARQAGLIRYCSSTGECDVPNGNSDLYDAVHFNKPRTTVVVSSRKKRGSKVGRRNTNLTPQVKEESKVVKFKEESQKNSHSQQQQQQQQQKKNKYGNEIIINRKNNDSSTVTTNSFKPVDEDLYKIPPHLLHTSKREELSIGSTKIKTWAQGEFDLIPNNSIENMNIMS